VSLARWICAVSGRMSSISRASVSALSGRPSAATCAAPLSSSASRLPNARMKTGIVTS
jgi:hypothetical protein